MLLGEWKKSFCTITTICVDDDLVMPNFLKQHCKVSRQMSQSFKKYAVLIWLISNPQKQLKRRRTDETLLWKSGLDLLLVVNVSPTGRKEDLSHSLKFKKDCQIFNKIFIDSTNHMSLSDLDLHLANTFQLCMVLWHSGWLRRDLPWPSL